MDFRSLIPAGCRCFPAVFAILAGASLQAQDAGLGVALKLRTGYGLSQADGLARRTFGFGFDFSEGLGGGRLGLELGYQYKPGNQFLLDPSTIATSKGTTVNPLISVDSRKNQLGGVDVRLSFAHPIASSPWSWQVGTQIGGSKFRQEYIGDVTDGATYEDTYNGIATRTTLPVSPYAGLVWNFSPEDALELNLMVLNYTAANYVHIAGTVRDSMGGNTAQDFVSTRKRSIPHIELAYAFRF